jgi:uncharacterized protein YjiS (DUF1127 family)
MEMAYSTCCNEPVSAPVRSSLEKRLVRWLDGLSLWRERARQRRTLMSMNDRMLADIGLDRGVIEREYTKPFWRP